MRQSLPRPCPFFFIRNGPFDGAMGFDMGGEFLVHVAGLATEGDPDLQDRLSFRSKAVEVSFGNIRRVHVCMGAF